MKKLICLITCVLILFIAPKKVNAQEVEEFPNNFIQTNYYQHSFVQERELTYEYLVVYTLPIRISQNLGVDDYFLITRYNFGFDRGVNWVDSNCYSLENVVTEPGYSELHIRFFILKSLVESRYPNDITPFFENESRVYVVVGEHDSYNRGFADGVKSITNKYTSYVFKWTLPFVTLVIISAIYVGYKKEWFHND